jgi:hypothetical protein
LQGASVPQLSQQRILSYSSCDTTKLEDAIAAVAANAFSEKEGPETAHKGSNDDLGNVYYNVYGNKKYRKILGHPA